MRYSKKIGGLIRGTVILGAAALLLPGIILANNDGQEAYDSFLKLSQNNAVGVILAEIKFAPDGHVAQCRVVRSNTPYALETSTTDFIESHWKFPIFAGDTRFLPITFDQLPSYSPQWDGDMAPPRNPLAVGDAERDLKLRLTFGTDGWIKDIRLADSSGLPSLDRETALWVKVHWHHDAYANQVLDAPFKFLPPPTPPPVVVAPTPVKPAALAPEPVAIPAMRVQ